MAALRLTQNYLSNRKQRTKINTEYNSLYSLGSLLFNIFLYDLFLIMNNIKLSTYADDNTSCAVGNNIE